MSTDLTLDQQLAVQTAVERLHEEFSSHYNATTIERVMHSSLDELLKSSTMTNFVPLLAERFTRDRLHALSRSEGTHTDGKQAVLFLCVENAGRSQMALGFFQHYAGDQAVGWSGGSAPATAVNPVAIEAMAELGIDISGELPKPWTDETVRAADVVITMGCGDTCPIFPGKKYEDWALDDPKGADIEFVRSVRDGIEQRVLNLLGELGIGPNPSIGRAGTDG
ncbi:arsenate reductase ArsC [Nocardioides sp. NPDC057772]|uniref:arsenate reductase ArsC n=1 Tax=Nocardioides sp. NPDC057772 TaxID=3346245 RepID=UPI00366D8D5C